MSPRASLRVADTDLHQVLEGMLGHDAVSAPIVRIARRPSPKRSSAALEELDVEFADGATFPLIFKNLGREALGERARRVKPSFMYDPRREIETYRQVLADATLGTPHFYGAVVDARRGRYWLFLERVAADELYQVADLAAWSRVATWLADAHGMFARQRVASGSLRPHLLQFDAAFYRIWPSRARLVATQAAASSGDAAKVAWLAARHEAIVERLVALPATLIHGEFYASNVLVQRGADVLRVCPVDWETAGEGPGLLDLAALTAGWPDGAQRTMAAAYHAALDTSTQPYGDLDDLLCSLAYCRLQCAIQWLGWFGRYQPPAEHARDWLGEAMRLAEALRL